MPCVENQLSEAEEGRNQPIESGKRRGKVEGRKSGECGIAKPRKNRCGGQSTWDVTEKQRCGRQVLLISCVTDCWL